MKKIMFMLAMLTMTVAAKAQFERGTNYLEAAVNNIGLSYNGAEEFRFGVVLKYGYFMEDNWQVNGFVGYNHYNINQNQLSVGAGGRFYVIENGLYLGANAKFVFEKGRNDFMPGIELGYSYFINDKVTIEPAIYYDQSIHDHKEYSTVGLKVGVGLYF